MGKKFICRQKPDGSTEFIEFEEPLEAEDDDYVSDWRPPLSDKKRLNYSNKIYDDYCGYFGYLH